MIMKKVFLFLFLIITTKAIAEESTQISLGAGSAQGALRNEETEDELELDGGILQFELQQTFSSNFILGGRYTQFEIERTDKDSTNTLSLTSRLTFQGLGLSGGYEFSFGSFLFQPKLTLYSGTSKVEFILNSIVVQDTGPGNGASLDLPLLYQAGKLVFGATYQSMYVGSQFEGTDVVMVADSAFLLNLGARF
jgi:hypothetical protein